MEETVVEGNESLRSPPRRRRSTFFERRESIVPQTPTKNVEPDTSTVIAEECPNSTNQDLTRYHDLLQSEKEQWKKEVNNRRHKYHDVRQQFQIALKTPGRSRMCYSALSNEDIEFLKAKTNTSHILEAKKKLHKSVKETRAFCKRLNELDDVILDSCERKVNTITDNILNYSRAEPME